MKKNSPNPSIFELFCAFILACIIALGIPKLFGYEGKALIVLFLFVFFYLYIHYKKITKYEKSLLEKSP